jgi:hypothetical protein
MIPAVMNLVPTMALAPTFAARSTIRLTAGSRDWARSLEYFPNLKVSGPTMLLKDPHVAAP